MCSLFIPYLIWALLDSHVKDIDTYMWYCAMCWLCSFRSWVSRTGWPSYSDRHWIDSINLSFQFNTILILIIILKSISASSPQLGLILGLTGGGNRMDCMVWRNSGSGTPGGQTHVFERGTSESCHHVRCVHWPQENCLPWMCLFRRRQLI